MEELQAEYGVKKEEESSASKNSEVDAQKLEIAELYEDAWEYEQDLENFEAELEIVNANEIKDIAHALTRERPDDERDYAAELKAVLEAAWTHMVEVEKTHPKEQLEIIKESTLGDTVQKLSAAYPDQDFEAEIKAALVKRWEMLITIKKEHIKEEMAMIKTSGLKTHYAKRIYKEVHGIK